MMTAAVVSSFFVPRIRPALGAVVTWCLLPAGTGTADRTGQRPHIYLEWTEGNPLSNFLRFFLFGQGEVAPVTREVIRGAEPDRARRPHVHAG